MKRNAYDGLLFVASLYSVIHIVIYVAIHSHMLVIQNFVVAVRARLSGNISNNWSIHSKYKRIEVQIIYTFPCPRIAFSLLGV